MQPLKIFLIRTFQPHWGEHSGINQFIKYIDWSRFEVKEHIVYRKRTKFPPLRLLKRMISTLLIRGGPKVYCTSDFWAEISALIHVTLFGYDVVFYLDGEHSINKLPKILPKLKSKDKKPKIIAMFHQPPETLHTLINTDVFKSIDHAIVLSRLQANDLSRFMPGDKISEMLHGIDVDYFHPDASRKEKDKFICLSVGNWLRDYDTVIEVSERMSKHPGIEFHIVSSKVNPSSGAGNIHVHTNVSDEYLLHLYQEADVFFMPMLDATANNAILEALACGVPIVTTELPGIECYLSGKEALLIEPGNPRLYQDAILTLYNDRTKATQMSESGRSRSVELSWANFARQIEHIILNA
jgi:glycosyltransferase involved in cell wall biosynthesis